MSEVIKVFNILGGGRIAVNLDGIIIASEHWKTKTACISLENDREIILEIPFEEFVEIWGKATEDEEEPAVVDCSCFIDLVMDQLEWSIGTFGGGTHTEGIVDHIRKELDEVLSSEGSVEEWVDVFILALDGLLRAGIECDPYPPMTHAEIARCAIQLIRDKQNKNKRRKWPSIEEQREKGMLAVEHIREESEE